jgi:hypothetical protein
MPVTVFDIKGLPGHRRERIEAAVVAGGKYTKAPHEAWIAADPLESGSGCPASVRNGDDPPRKTVITTASFRANSAVSPDAADASHRRAPRRTSRLPWPMQHWRRCT